MHLSYTILVTLFYAIEWIIRVVMVFVVPRNRKPSSATAWLVIIMVVPLLGLLTYWLLGSPKLSKKRRAIQNKMNRKICKLLTDLKQDKDFASYFVKELPDRLKPLAELNSRLSFMPVLSGNELELISGYNSCYKKIIKDINNAQNFVHIEFFIITLDETTEEIITAIEKAVKRGVKVRLLLDAIGSRRFKNYRKLIKRCHKTGIECHKILPLNRLGPNFNRPDLRNHRKIVVIDGHIAYTGSQNLIRQDYHRKDGIKYLELMTRVTGPVCAELNAIFATDWFAETGELLDKEVLGIKDYKFKNNDFFAQALPSGPSYKDENNLKLFTSLIHMANKKIIITNPYFVPDDSLMTAMTSAAQKGVEVIMINSEAMDQKVVGHAQRSYYEQLLHAGIKIYWYPWPILVHSKSISIDDDIAIIGSSNLDIRSFLLNFEVCLLVHNKDFVKQLNKIENKYLSKAKLITIKQWEKQPLRSLLLDNLARLTAVLQ